MIGPHNTILYRAAQPGTRFFYADACLYNPEYGSAVIPKVRWEQAQKAEQMWANSEAVRDKRHSGLLQRAVAGKGDRADEHVKHFDYYRTLPTDLGRIVEIGAGPYTQTLFALRARPDCKATSLTVVDPGIPGYLSTNRTSYGRGFLDIADSFQLPVELLAMGAEEVPRSRDGTYDTVVMLNCVEHTFNAFATLHSAYRLLKPGGVFVFQERSVRLETGVQMYHPVRLTVGFFDDYLSRLYTPLFRFRGRTEQMRLRKFVQGEVYYIGRRTR